MTHFWQETQLTNYPYKLLIHRLQKETRFKWARKWRNGQWDKPSLLCLSPWIKRMVIFTAGKKNQKEEISGVGWIFSDEKREPNLAIWSLACITLELMHFVCGSVLCQSRLSSACWQWKGQLYYLHRVNLLCKSAFICYSLCQSGGLWKSESIKYWKILMVSLHWWYH